MDDLNARAKRLENLFPQVFAALFGRMDDPFSALPVGQLRMVRALEGGPKTPTQVAQHLNLTMGAVSQLAQRLRVAGIVVEEADEQDRRSKRLALSEEGRTMMNQRVAVRVAYAKGVLENVPEEAQMELMRGLEALLQSTKGGVATNK